MERKQPRAQKIRLLIVAALLIALTAAYLTVLHKFHVSEQPGERMFGAARLRRSGRGLYRAAEHRRRQRGHAGARLSFPKPV